MTAREEALWFGCGLGVLIAWTENSHWSVMVFIAALTGLLFCAMTPAEEGDAQPGEPG
jgi:hypothetical protein